VGATMVAERAWRSLAEQRETVIAQQGREIVKLRRALARAQGKVRKMQARTDPNPNEHYGWFWS